MMMMMMMVMIMMMIGLIGHEYKRGTFLEGNQPEVGRRKRAYWREERIELW
jgi:hypothetical protein